MHHNLKTWPENYKTHDCGLTIRESDRGFRLGDTVRFLEWNDKGGFTGKVSNDYSIMGIIEKHPGVKPDYVILLLYGPWGQCPGGSDAIQD